LAHPIWSSRVSVRLRSDRAVCQIVCKKGSELSRHRNAFETQ
jgi:hypothetical protein